MTETRDAVMVRDLYKAFGSTTVLTAVDLTVPTGSITAVLGPSGSGKTTLLRIVAGFEQPDAGSVTIAGTVVADERTNVPVERRDIGYVSQEGSLFPHLDVRANVGFGLPRRRRRGSTVDELLAAVGLEGLSHRYPHQLSGGQQQRVAVARALATGPRVLLLDEPFASLDANLRESVRSEVCAILRRSGTTAVLVTHDQDEALSMADRVAVLRRGAIAQIGTPRDLYDHPRDAEIASFVGEANLLTGLVVAGRVRTGLGELEPCRPLPSSESSPLTVLVRPEQLTLANGSTTGHRARVLSVDFHGHEAIVRVEPEEPGLPSPLVARVPGGMSPAPGTRIVVAAEGPVEVWPAPVSEIRPPQGGASTGGHDDGPGRDDQRGLDPAGTP